MSALDEAVQKHRGKLRGELSNSLRQAGLEFDEEGRFEFIDTCIDGLLKRVRKSADDALPAYLEQVLSENQLKPGLIGSSLVRMAAAVRSVLFLEMKSRRIAAMASGGIDRAVADVFEDLGQRLAHRQVGEEAGDFKPKDPTIIRNINEILGSSGGEVHQGTVIAIAAHEKDDAFDMQSSIAREYSLGAARDAITRAGARLIMGSGNLVVGLLEASVGDTDAEEAMEEAIRLGELPDYERCSIGLARGPVYIEESEGVVAAYGDTLSSAVALAAGGAWREVRCDRNLNDMLAATFVLRAVGTNAYRLDRDQPKWLDRWEHAAFVGEPEPVGHGSARRSLRSALRAPDRKVSVVGVKAKAGMGKYRLLLETLGSLDIESDRIIVGQPNPLTPAPYWPLITMARQILGLSEERIDGRELKSRVATLAASTAATDELKQVLPTLGTLLGAEDIDEAAIEELEPAAMRSEIARSLRLLLEAAADREPDKPMVVLVREAQGLDVPTAHALGHVLRSYAGAAQLIVALTYRGTFKPPAAFAAAGFEEIALEPLEDKEMLTLARSMLEEEELPVGVEELLLKRMGGSPMMTINLVHLLVESGALQRRGGEWEAVGVPAPSAVPRRLSDLLAERVKNLPENLSGMLKSAATVGESLPRGTLELVWVSRGIASDEIQRWSALLVEMRFFAQQPDGSLRFTHPLLREVTYRLQTDEERAETHRLVAVASVEQYPDAIHQVPAVLFHHWFQAGETDAAREAAVHGAKRAMLLHDHKRGLTLVNEGLLTCENDTLRSNQARFELLSVRERIHDARQAREEQKKDLQALAELGEEIGEPHRLGLALHRVARFNLLTGDVAKATAIAEKSLHLLKDGEPLDLSNALRTVALIRWHGRDPNGAAAALTEALRIYEEIGHKRGQGFVLHSLGLFSLDTGAVDQARDYFERALPLKEATDDREGVAVVLDCLGQVALLEGDTDESIRSFEMAVNERLATSAASSAAASQVNLGQALLKRDPSRTEELARAAIKATRKRRLARTNVEANILLSRALLEQGRKQSAGRPASLAVKRAKELGARLLLLRGQLAQAEVDLAYSSRSRMERALMQAEAAAKSALDSGAVRWRIEALSLLATAYNRLDPSEGAGVAKEALAMLEERKHVGLDEAMVRERCEAVISAAGAA